MYATERQDAIERLIATDGRVSVVDLAGRFAVTTETVRRDLAQLESVGALRRVHGGAVAGERGSTNEPSLPERVVRHSAAKAAIGAVASEALGADFRGSVFFDAGTTTAAVADHLAPRLADEPIEVVTHALTIAHSLAGIPGVALSLIGGRVRGLTAAAVGADTVRAIEALRPDVAFLGTNGVSSRFGLSTPDPEEAAVKKAIVRSARRVIVVADAEKHGRELLVSFAPLTAVDVLVTDVAPEGDVEDALRDADVEVWVP
ncbi:DeoR/GlpR family DNA-binding transcription regulator [Microbacterium sp. NPDC057407]|uniref:DeoR/GlpR family DNA-binding transcription regulator n=1 Tax=Microbacterium sp. NPDC057407 TaxID=3346120 RepID=UPI003671F09B